MVDLMKLDGVMKTGEIVNADGKSAEVITPVFRASFPRLKTPERYKGTGNPRYTCGLIFNTGNPEESAFVDLRSVVGATLAKVALANNLSLKATGVNPFSEGEKYNKAGELVDGYGPGLHWASMAKYPKKESSIVQCFGATSNACPPETIYGGCYARARIQIYKPPKWDRLALGISWVQFVTDGDAFGGEDTEYDAAPAIPGASGVSTPDGSHESF